jgi:hypothetical protein
MNRGLYHFSHTMNRLSGVRAVEELCILWETRPALGKQSSLTVMSADLRSDFSHEGSLRN